MKNKQSKWIFAMLIIITLISIGLSFIYMIKLKNISNEIVTQEMENTSEILEHEMQNISKIFAISIIILGGLGIAVMIILSKTIIDKTKKQNEKVEKLAAGEDVDIRTIVLHMTDGVIAFNMEGKIILINPAATRYLRLMPEDDSFDKIFQKLNVDISMEKVIYLENWTSSEERVTIGDRYINMFFAPFKNENNRAAGVTVVIQDITEHVKLDVMRKEFVADVSHELKTPITSIMGYADTLLESEYDKQTQDRFLKVIATEARRMAKLVTDLLTLSKYDNNEIRTEKQEFDLGELVKQCQEKLQLEINKKKHVVECFVTANVPPVYADKDGVERVILNILSNSIKYTRRRWNY